LPKVIAISERIDSGARINGIGSLSEIAPGDMTTLPVFIRLLDDVNDGMKQTACAGLTHFGPEAKAAIPGLHRCLKENAFYVQFNATVAMWRIAHEAPSIALLKTAMSQDENGDYIPLRTLELLGGLSVQTDETRSIVRQLAKASNAEVRTNALALLEKIGKT
jgi:HEAT repeat protein